MFLTGLLAFSALILSASSASQSKRTCAFGEAAQAGLTGQWVAEFEPDRTRHYQISIYQTNG